MSLALAALVLSTLSPATPVTQTALAQQKIQIIKGKKGTGTVKNNATTEGGTSAASAQTQANAQRAQELDQKAAALDARQKELSAKEQALDEKQAAAAEGEKKKADQLKAQQKHIEKVSEQNQQLWQQASDSLAGD